MPKLTTGEGGSDFELIPENEIANARVQSVELNEFKYDGEDVQKLKWVFLLTDPGPWQGKEIFGDTSTVFTPHPNCKAYNWVSALTGRDYAQGEELDTDDLLGLPCRIIIKHKDDRQGRTWMRVREVLPLRAVTQQAPSPEEAPF